MKTRIKQTRIKKIRIKQTLDKQNFSDVLLASSIDMLYDSYCVNSTWDIHYKPVSRRIKGFSVNFFFSKNLTCDVVLLEAHRKQWRYLMKTENAGAIYNYGDPESLSWYRTSVDFPYLLKNQKKHLCVEPRKKTTTVCFNNKTPKSIFLLYCVLQAKRFRRRGRKVARDMFYIENLHFSYYSGDSVSLSKTNGYLSKTYGKLAFVEPISLFKRKIRRIFAAIKKFRYPFTSLFSKTERMIHSSLEEDFFRLLFVCREFSSVSFFWKFHFRVHFSEISRRPMQTLPIVNYGQARILMLLLLLDAFCLLEFVIFVHFATKKSAADRILRHKKFLHLFRGKGLLGTQRTEYEEIGFREREFLYGPSKRQQLVSWFTAPLRWLHLWLLNARTLLAFKFTHLKINSYKAAWLPLINFYLKRDIKSLVEHRMAHTIPSPIKEAPELNYKLFNYNNFYKPYLLMFILLRVYCQTTLSSFMSQSFSFDLLCNLTYSWVERIFPRWVFFIGRFFFGGFVFIFSFFNYERLALFIRQIKFFIFTAVFFFCGDFVLNLPFWRTSVAAAKLFCCSLLLLWVYAFLMNTFGSNLLSYGLWALVYGAVLYFIALLLQPTTFIPKKYPSLHLNETFRPNWWQGVFSEVLGWVAVAGIAAFNLLFSVTSFILRIFFLLVGKSWTYLWRGILRIRRFFPLNNILCYLLSRSYTSSRPCGRKLSVSVWEVIYFRVPSVIVSGILTLIKTILTFRNFHSARTLFWMSVEFVHAQSMHPFWWNCDDSLFLSTSQLRGISIENFVQLGFRKFGRFNIYWLLARFLPHMSVLYRRCFFSPFEYLSTISFLYSGTNNGKLFFTKSFSDLLFWDYYILTYFQKIYSTRSHVNMWRQFFIKNIRLPLFAAKNWHLIAISIFIILSFFLYIINWAIVLALTYLVWIAVLQRLFFYSLIFSMSIIKFLKMNKTLLCAILLFFVAICLVFFMSWLFLVYMLMKLIFIFLCISLMREK